MSLKPQSIRKGVKITLNGKEAEKQEVIIKTEEPKKVVSSKGIVFKIQISAGGKKLETTPSNFK